METNQDIEFDYHTLFQQNIAGIFQTTAKGVIVHCNEAFAHMLKYSSPDELINTNAFALYFSQVDRDNFVEKVRDKNRLHNYENILKCKDGTPLYVIENIFLHKDKTGEEFCDGIMIDISERKKYELELKDINLKYKALFDNPMHAFVLSNINGDILEANHSACEMFGYSPKEFLKLNRKDILEMKDPRFIEAVAKRKKTGIAGAEIFAIKKNGDRFPMAFVSSEFLNAKGEERIGSLITDITVRKRTEEKIILSEKRFKSLVQNSTDLLSIMDKEGTYIYVSPTSQNILGYDPEFLTGKNAFSFIHEDDLKMAVETISLVTSYKLVHVPFFRFLDSKGEWRWIDCTITNLLDDPAVKGYVKNGRDITEKKYLEEAVTFEKMIKHKEITEAVITAQESERSEIGRELHDNVNQLLTAVKLYTDMAKNDKESKESFLDSASTYVVTAIEEIRKLSKALITPLIQDIGLTDAIKNLAEEIQLIHPVKILFDVTTFSEENLNQKYKLNLFRIVQEQINNILKHANAKTINILFERKNNHLIISIVDDGVGFDTAKRKKGIGVSNIISRAELYKGEVIIVSEPGKGCFLTIDFILSDLILDI